MNIDINDKVSSASHKNSIIFLTKVIELLNNSSDNSKELPYENTVIATVFIQMSLELAIKFAIIRNNGIRSILNDKKQTLLDDESLYNLFIENKLKVKEFDNLKNYIKTNENIFYLKKNSILLIEKFQLFRNKLVHLHYNFTNRELDYLKSELIEIIVHIIIVLLYTKDFTSPSEFYINILTKDTFKKLISNRLYINEMYNLASANNSKVFNCIFCNNKTLGMSEFICYSCLTEYDNKNIYGFTDCVFCKTQKSVIYDRLNISNNDHITKGLCLKCDIESLVYECSICETNYNLEFNENGEKQCKKGFCKND
ncbi:hypothetical protein [Leptospira kanakyensis]|uniref:hypothetical protein n=1 Tax=Leptospira kanakyensis TaxID=2484968 RepID=UPI00223D57D6|nr:hypothetical protein [Leptospira kanakyensis]MCW7471715.1 hypothetical protein [Leptospira kanakyensis]MCW7483272.1 hypothetical protein [Leptospira kanakyensis]